MNATKETKIGISAEIGGLVAGLTLIIWSIEIAIMGGANSLGLYQAMFAFTFIFPPLGSYLVVTSGVDIIRVIRNE